MKTNYISKGWVFLVLLACAFTARAWTYQDCVAVNFNHSDCAQYPRPTTPTPTPQQQNQAAYGGYGSADAAAQAWSSLNAQQRAELSASLTSAQRQELMNSINIRNANRNTNNNTANGGEGGQGGSATAAVTGNTTTVGGDTNLSWTPVQVAALPPVITSGGFQLTAVGGCGPRQKVRAFDRQLRFGTLFGGWSGQHPVETVHGVIEGPEKEPFIYRLYEEPEPFYVKVKEQVGHRVYLVVSNESIGGGSSSAYNSAHGDGGRGFGLGNNGAGSTASAGYLVVDCVRKAFEASTKPEPPKVSVTPAPAVVPVVTPPKDLYTLREEVTTPGRRGGVIADIPPDFCKKNPEKCRKVEASAGKRTFVERTIDCLKPESPADAKACAERTSKLGQPPVRGEEVLK